MEPSAMKNAIAIALMLPFSVFLFFVLLDIFLNMIQGKKVSEFTIVLFILAFLWGVMLFFTSCSPTSAQQPAPVASFGHVLQVVNEIESPKPKEIGEVEKVEIKQPTLAAMQLTITLSNYYATRCLEDGTVNEECLNEAMKCAGQLKQQDNMTDALLKCAKGEQ